MRYLVLVVAAFVLLGIFKLGYDAGFGYGYLACESQLDEGGD